MLNKRAEREANQSMYVLFCGTSKKYQKTVSPLIAMQGRTPTRS